MLVIIIKFNLLIVTYFEHLKFSLFISYYLFIYYYY